MSLPISDKKKKRIPSYQEVMGEQDPVKSIPSYEEVMGEKKNPIGNDLGNGSEPSQDLNQTISQVDLGKPLQNMNTPEGNAPADANDLISQAKYADVLKNKTIPAQPMGGGQYPGGAATDIDAVNYSKKIKENISSQGYDADKLSKDFKDVPDYVYDIPELTKPELLKAYKENPQLYERKVATANWQPALLSNLEKEKIPEQFQGVKVALHNIANPDLDLQTKRNNINNIVSTINQHGGDKKEDMLNHLSVELSNVYGEAATKPDNFKDDPLSAQLNSNQLAAYHWMQDTKPKEFQQYQSALLDDKDIKGNFEAQLSKDEAGKKLDQIGIMLQKNYAQEHLNPIVKDYTTLLNKSQTPEGLTPDEQIHFQQLEQAGKPYADIVSNSDKDEQTLTERYPKASVLDANNFAQELIGQKHTGLDWLAMETGKATQNTAKAVSDFASELFNSDKENQIHQAEILGSNSLSENSTYLKQENQTTKTFKPTVSKELQTDIDNIKNDDNLSGRKKLDKVNDLLLHRPGEWQRTPIDNQTNIGLTSLMYGVGGMAANLAPFMASELLTGGGATASALRKFTSAFTSAAATGFHDSYVQALKDGEQNPFATAMRVTAINSAAMAGADTPGAIKKMLGNKTGIGKLVEKMTDTEIDAALKQEPKALGLFKKSVQAIKGAGKTILDNTGTAAKVSAFTTGGQIANDAIDNKLKSPEDYLKEAAISTLKFATLGTVLGAGKIASKPTDINLGALMESAKNPEGFSRALEVMEKNGTITPIDAAQVRNNIDKVSKIYEKSAILKSDKLSDPDKREYLHNALIKMDAMEAEGSLPPRQAAEALKKAMVADHKNGILLDNPTDKQLESKKSRLEGILEPKKDDEGKAIELPEKIKKDAEAELEAVNDTIDERSAKVAHEKAKKFVDTKLSQPIEGIDEQEVPVGDNVPPPTDKIIPDEKAETIKVPQSSTEGSTSDKSVNSPIGETENGKEKITGIAQRVREQRADVTGLTESQIGLGWNKEEALQRGKDLIDEGVSPEQVLTDFEKDGKLSDDTMAIMQARSVELARESNKAGDKYGVGSKEYKDALKKEQDFLDRVKPMQTKSSRIFTAQQGDIDIDSGTITGLSRAFKSETGRDLSPIERKKATELSDKVKEQDKKIADLEKQVKDLLNKKSKEPTKGNFESKARRIAAKIMNSETPSWLKISDKDVKTQGISEKQLKKLLADATVNMGRLLDKGVEFSKAVKEAVNELVKMLGENKRGEIEKNFTDHYKNNIETIKNGKDIWEHARDNYIDKGKGFEEMIQGTARDFGISPNEVRYAITEPKGARKITDEMYRAQYQRRQAIQRAEMWVKTANQSKVAGFFKALPNIFFGLKTFGHGTVGAITHAGTGIFKPSRWKVYWPFALSQFKYVGNIATYEKAMSDLKNDPDFTFWKRAGLAVDPKESYDEYEKSSKVLGSQKLGTGWHNLVNAGERGFNALKVYRLNLAKSYYDMLSDEAKADPNTAKEIAKITNHASGTSEVKLPTGSNVVFFAPKLEASRWQRLITDPAKAIATLSKWNTATQAEKQKAIRVAKNAGELTAVYFSALMANAGFLAATGSNQKINLTDPSKNDWLKFKGAGKTLDPTGGILSSLSFLTNIIKASKEEKKPLDIIKSKVWSYGTGKFSPFASTLKDFALRRDFSGNVMPFSSDKPEKGKHKLSWEEYLLDQQTPIPISEAVKEAKLSMKEKGMSDVQIDDIIKGLAAAVIVGGTGAHVGNEPTDKSNKIYKGGGASGDYAKPHSIGRPVNK